MKKIVRNLLWILAISISVEFFTSMKTLNSKKLIIPDELIVTESIKEGIDGHNFTTIDSKEIIELLYDELSKNSLRDRGCFYKNLNYPSYFIIADLKTNGFYSIWLDQNGNIEIHIDKTVYKGKISKEVTDKFIRKYLSSKNNLIH